MATKKAAKTSKPVAKKAPAEKAPAKKAPGKKAPAKALRRDYEVYNESTGFVVTSVAACGTVDGGDRAWDKAAKAGVLLPIELIQDDPLLVRVVLGPLRPEEEEAAIGRLEHRVRVEDGQLVLGGGSELLVEGLDEYREYAQVVDVPPGEYHVTVLATAHGLVGDPLLGRAKRSKVGAWWRETRGKAAMPGWVAQACHAHTKLDPGHEDEWADAPETDEDEELLDFVVHLAPLTGAPPTLPKLQGGFVSFGGWTITAPAKCPAALLAVKPVKAPEPAASQPQAAAGEAAPLGVEARLGGATPKAIKGGPVKLPLARLEDLFRLAYLADADACFELRLELPAGKKPPKLPAREHVNADVEGQELRLTQGGEGGRWFALQEVAAAAEGLVKAKLPDGTLVDLLGAPETAGRGQRWRGQVKGGQLLLGESVPAVDAATLEAALAFSAETAKGAALTVRSDAEARTVLKDPDVKSMVVGLVHAGGVLRLGQPDAGLLHFVAAPLFRARFGGVFACAPPDTSAGEADAALEQLDQAVTAKVAKTTLAGGIVHHGVSGNFHKFDLVVQRPAEFEHVQDIDRQLARTGYVVVGDLVSSRFPEVAIRGYARADGDGDTWGALLCGLLESKFEFVTEIVTDSGDSWLTTSLERAKDDPEKRLYRTGCPDLNFRKLQPLHDRHRARKQTLGGRPRQAPRDPVALAAAIDRSLCRQLGLAKPLDD